MTTFFHNQSGLKLPSRFSSKVCKLVDLTLKTEKKKMDGDVTVVFVDKKEIRQLNRKYLNESGDTDVIAFPYDGFGGDIFICGQVAMENANRFDEPRERELMRLVIHGTLHLLGYSDWPKKQKDKMWAQQEPLVEKAWYLRKRWNQ